MKYDGESAHISHVENSFSILKKIPGTPSYWRVFRNDIMAKIEQVGQFHMFFTLSCAEKRWPEILAAILQLEGNKLSFNLPWDGKEDSIFINDEPLSEFKKSVNWSEKLRKNIMLITQMFDSRVKAFVKNILMGLGEGTVPISHFSYRVEFQARGLPHIHGVLWLDDEETKNLLTDNKTFDLDKEKEFTAFANKWTTCELPEDEVLRKKVKSVLFHTHKYCKKKTGHCRFGFPKLPSKRTLIARPNPENWDEETLKEKRLKLKKFCQKSSRH